MDHIELLEKRKDTIPKSYNNYDTCRNCEHVFIRTDYDDCPGYFCTREAPERPLCNSVGMRETIGNKHPDLSWDKQEILQHNNYKAWDEWSIPREVFAWGVCDNWKFEEKKQ